LVNDASPFFKKITMHEESLTQNTKSVLDTLGTVGFIKNFYLAGGTAFALYFGHRFSIDLDWFAEKFRYTPSFRHQLEKFGRLSIDSESEDTFNGALDGVKISFFEYPYPLISPKEQYKGDIYLAGIPDIAAMKLEAVGRRGSSKDFVDVYFLLKRYSLEELLGFVRKKFANMDYNEIHLLKALTYFEDAKGTAMPKLVKPISWPEIIKTISQKVKDYMEKY